MFIINTNYIIGALKIIDKTRASGEKILNIHKYKENRLSQHQHVVLFSANNFLYVFFSLIGIIFSYYDFQHKHLYS